MNHDQTIGGYRLPGSTHGHSGVLPPLPRRKLGRGILALLILLRVYVIAAIPIVAYAFFHALMPASH